MVKHRLDMIFVQETKKDCMSDGLVKSIVGHCASEWIVLLTVGTVGGILLAWNPSVMKVMDARMGSFSIPLRLRM